MQRVVFKGKLPWDRETLGYIFYRGWTRIDSLRLKNLEVSGNLKLALNFAASNRSLLKAKPTDPKAPRLLSFPESKLSKSTPDLFWRCLCICVYVYIHEEGMHTHRHIFTRLVQRFTPAKVSGIRGSAETEQLDTNPFPCLKAVSKSFGNTGLYSLQMSPVGFTVKWKW